MTAAPRILLVEDDPADAHLALAVLRQLSLADHVKWVADGVEALEFLREEGSFRGRPPGHPTVILLDLKLPRLDGFEVLEQVKSDPQFKNIPIVVLTSSGQERDLKRAYDLGANSYVIKSIEFDHYSDCLRSLGRYWTAINQQPPAPNPPSG